MSDKKEVILQIDNVRIKRWDDSNVTVEREETHYYPKEECYVKSWKFHGYARNVISGIKLIQRKDLLVEDKSISNLENYLSLVEQANKKLLAAVENMTEYRG